MKITEELNKREKRKNSTEATLNKSIVSLMEHLVSQAKTHLKQVIAQHPEFDLHDETHSDAVIKNMEELLGSSGIKARSSFELFLLVTSAYLHDCAMAVPEWELNLFRLSEGLMSPLSTRETYDLKPKMSFVEAKQFIETHNAEIFEDYETAKKWMFSAKNEQLFIGNLASRLIEYQDFRNGHAEKFKNLANTPEEYRIFSKQLRQDFVRQTHWLWIETWIRNLDSLFEEKLGSQWGKALAHDLAAICRSHGESKDFIYDLPNDRIYHGKQRSNLRMVALMLRIADIIHFTPDRTPEVLYQQKQIASEISQQHWKVKNQGIDCTISDNSNGERTVAFTAYFQIPQLYFLFHDYLDYADREFELWNELFHQPSGASSSPLDGGLPILNSKIDRTSIRHDSECFQPVPNLHFTLSQRRILDLLMGVKLYKNRFACLRELYQNSIDACRCMLASSDVKQIKGEIEFGIAIDETSKERYLYCRDNGIGMTKDIVSRYLLQIGNSFYKSQEFQRLNTNWNSPFTPTSQFGIGILSCFMIGKRIEIVSKPVQALDKADDAINFIIDGPHEHFYYKHPSVEDKEFIGTHGTLVKIFLSDSKECELNNHPIENAVLFQHASDHLSHDSPLSTEAKMWKSHLHHHIASFVAQCPLGISTNIKLSNDQLITLPRATAPFDYLSLGISRENLAILSASKERFGREDDKETLIEIIDKVTSREITIEHKDVQFRCIVNLPKSGTDISLRGLDSIGTISMDKGILVDGIRTENSHLPYEMEHLSALARVGVFDFTGHLRPSLSVDRTSIVEWPKGTEQVILPFRKLLVQELLREIEQYCANENLDPNMKETNLIWEYIFSRFGFLAADLITTIVDQTKQIIQHEELATVTNHKDSIQKFAIVPSVVIRLANYHALEQSTKLLLCAKLATAKKISVNDATISVDAGKFSPLASCTDWDHCRERQYIFQADTWNGDYKDFDIVTCLWPVVPAKIFAKISSKYRESVSINQRTKMVHQFGNSFSAISNLDPRLIHPHLGLYEIESRHFGESTPSSKIGRFEKARNNFWLHDIGDDDDLPDNELKHYILVGFIAPQPLNEKEKADLELFKSKDPEYTKGVETGWSVLFLGKKDHNVVCLPGLVSRRKLLNAVPETFWETHSDKQFLFLDGETPQSLGLLDKELNNTADSKKF